MTWDKIAALMVLAVPSLILAMAGWQFSKHWVGKLIHVLGLIGLAVVLAMIGVVFWVHHT